jgi:hypothetical protein
MEDERRDGNGRRRLDDVTERLGSVEERQGRVFDLLIGGEELQMDGTLRRKTEEGMDYKVDVLYEQAQNGGLRARLVGGDRVLLWTAVIASSGAVLAAWVGS